eukprot:289514_1
MQDCYVELDSQNNVINTNRNPFKHLDNWILCLPMFATKSSSNNNRCMGLNAFCIGINLIFAIACCCYWSFKTYDEFHFNFYSISFMVAIVTLSMGRIVILYYFATQFNYPWNKVNVTNAKPTSTRFKIEIVSGIIALIILFVLDFELGLIHLISDLLYTYFIHLPIIFAQFVVSVVFFEAKIKMEQLINTINNNNNKTILDFDSILTQYSQCRDKFKKHYKVLQVFVMMKFISCIAFRIGEIGTSHIQLNTETGILNVVRYLIYAVIDVLPIFEFLISASKVTSVFETLYQQLWKIGSTFKTSQAPNEMGTINTEHNNVYCQYVYLVNYISWHPMNITIIGWKVSKSNATKILLIYAAKVLYNSIIR